LAARATQLAQKAPRKLLEAIVARLFGTNKNTPHEIPQFRLTPIVSRRLLCTRRITIARRFQQQLRCRGIERRIVA